MPMIAASTAAAFGRAPRPPPCLRSRPAPSRRRRRRPNRSPAAPTPRGCVVERQRLHEQQLRAFELPVLLGRDDGADDSAICMSLMHVLTPRHGSLDVPVIDDADDRRRRPAARRDRTGNAASRPRTKNTCSPTPAPTESSATSVRPAGCRRTRRAAGARAASSPTRFASLTVDDDVADDAGELHRQASVLDLDGVDDADDGGVDRAVLQARRHARRAAADDEHRLADAGIDGVDGDEVVAFGFAARDPSGARRAACC